MATKEELFKAQFKAQFGDKIDLENKLSYDSKVKNVFGMKDTKHTIRIKVDNKSGQDIMVYVGNTESLEIMREYGLPKGIVFTGDTLKGLTIPEDKSITVTSLNREQVLEYIDKEIAVNPVFFREISFKSYQVSESGNRMPDDSNFGNEIVHYTLASIKAELKKSTPLRLGQNESRKDVNTSVMTVDTIKEKFPAIASKNDAVGIQVNDGTQLEITFKVGARWSESELFHRQIMGALDMLSSGASPEDCGCK